MNMDKPFPEYKTIPVSVLIPYARNSRTHSPQQVDKIAASIKEFGFLNPIIVDGENGIIAGHGRVLAAQKLGLDTLPVIEASHLTEAQRRAYVIADNRLALDAGWDNELLKVELQDLDAQGFDLTLTGFELGEIGDLLAEPTEGLTDEDAVPEVPAQPVTAEGDVWLLGRHRLMCGDSTSIDAVDKLMDGRKADMVFTDPPYNIDYQGVKDKRAKIKNDKMADEDFVQFLRDSLMGCETMYVCCSWQYAGLFKQAMTDLARAPKAMIVWNKVNPAQHLDKYFKQHEIIFYYGDFGGQKTLRGDVWELKRQRNTVHPTMKPVELIDMAMIDQPDKELVYDAFGGSGSTLISCEKNHRDCRIMELDPKYCDVIINRWQDFTGQQVTLESTDQTFNALRAERHDSAAA
jgi:ParB-like chromosome segregation protein Spo0J